MAWVPAAIAAAGAIASSVLGNKAKADAAQAQDDFQERMRATQYQTAVKDMQAAGLNPMLAYAQGGAGTPIGAKADVESPLQNVVSSAQQATSAQKSLQDINQSEAAQKQIDAQTKQIESQTMEHSMNSALIAAQIDQIQAQTGVHDANASNIRAAILGTTAKSAEAMDTYNANADQGDGSQSTFKSEAAARKNKAEQSKYDLLEGKANAEKARLGNSKNRAESNFYESDIGKNSPYIQLGGDIATSAAQMFKLGRGR